VDSTAATRPILEDVQRLNELLTKATHSPQDKEDMQNEEKRPFFRPIGEKTQRQSH
jgi:hypothetical protein